MSNLAKIAMAETNIRDILSVTVSLEGIRVAPDSNSAVMKAYLNLKHEGNVADLAYFLLVNANEYVLMDYGLIRYTDLEDLAAFILNKD